MTQDQMCFVLILFIFLIVWNFILTFICLRNTVLILRLDNILAEWLKELGWLTELGFIKRMGDTP